MTQTPTAAMSKEMQDCVEACMTCHSVCEETMSSCMSMEDTGRMPVMRALIDCSETTRVCADMMMRRSPMAAEMCALCAKACDRCAEACEAMPQDELMRRCAEACRSCAQACRTMAGARM